MAEATDRLNAALDGRYRIERHLGAGGMATVYLAQDLKHDRQVAVKVLKPELAAVLGAERFVVEIKTTASLQHPHILPLFDSGSADGFLYYVMPFIEGETLRDKLNRETQLGVEEAVRITREVADALDYAHRRGVIHRDIKPENILLHDGRPMVADFGIALAVSAAAGGRMTETGLSLGTPHYMSPEQATADKDITARSDVYSLACVLYEMLTGNPPHTGASAQQIIMRIITDEPRPVTELRRSVPPHVAAAVARALEKLPADRFDSARAFQEALGSVTFTHALTAAGAVAATPPARPAGVSRGAFAAVVATAVIGIAVAGWGLTRPGTDQPVVRFDLTTGDVVPTAQSDVIISPDGSMLAVPGRRGGVLGIFARRLDGGTELQLVPGTAGGILPSFSPDSRWLAFRRNSDGALLKVPVAGGGAVTLIPPGDSASPYFSEWASNDAVVFTSPVGTFRVSANGGKPVHLPGSRARTLFALPDGSGFLTSNAQGISFYDIDRDTSVLLIPAAAHPSYVETGHLLYVSEDNGLFAVPFDLDRHRVVGEPARVFDRVAPTAVARGYSVSRNGTIVVRGATGRSIGGATQFVIMERGGRADTLRLPPARRLLPRFSPDGRSIVFEQHRGSSGMTDIHTHDLVTGASAQLTFERDNDEPVWSSDGKQIAFARLSDNGDEDLVAKPSDNSGPERVLWLAPGNQNPSEWRADGTLLFVQQSSNGAPGDLFTLRPSGDAQPSRYLEGPWNEDDAHVSPDGTLATFTSNEDGSTAVWIRDFPKPLGKWRVSPGSSPRWSPDGHYVYFWKSGVPLDTLLRARVDRTPGVVLRSPEIVTTLAMAGVVNWDLHPDGNRFIVTIDDVPASGRAGPVAGPEYLVVLNWFKELRALLRAGDR
ncbi:MAG TPA: protein kinase [Gemmatimonadaceae bacterium]